MKLNHFGIKQNKEFRRRSWIMLCEMPQKIDIVHNIFQAINSTNAMKKNHLSTIALDSIFAVSFLSVFFSLFNLFVTFGLSSVTLVQISVFWLVVVSDWSGYLIPISEYILIECLKLLNSFHCVFLLYCNLNIDVRIFFFELIDWRVCVCMYI